MSGLPQPSSTSTALITGASSGIGIELARLLAERGHHLTLVARREDRLKEVAAELSGGGKPGADVVACDLADPEARGVMVGTLLGGPRNVEILVNNAGFGLTGRMFNNSAERHTEMIRLNIEAVVDLMDRFSPGMVERGRGGILNVASTAGFQPLPGMAVYAATKSFVLSVSEAAHTELSGRGVTVTALCPGPVRTEFAEVANLNEFESNTPDRMWMEADETARIGIEGFEAGKRVVIAGNLNKISAAGGRHLPRWALLPLVKGLYGRN